MRKLFLLALVALGVTSCAPIVTTTFENDYTVELVRVERPSSTAERYGEYTISSTEEGNVTKYTYADDMISGVFVLGEDDLSFIINNKTEHSIKLVWDSAAFIDFDGTSQGIMHKGIKYSEKSQSQRPSIIAKNGRLSDVMQPIDNVYYISGYYGGWFTSPILKSKADTATELKPLGEKYLNKTVSFLIPLEIEGVVNEYTFTFEVTAFQPQRTTSSYTAKDGTVEEVINLN